MTNPNELDNERTVDGNCHSKKQKPLIKNSQFKRHFFYSY